MKQSICTHKWCDEIPWDYDVTIILIRRKGVSRESPKKQVTYSQYCPWMHPVSAQTEQWAAAAASLLMRCVCYVGTWEKVTCLPPKCPQYQVFLLIINTPSICFWRTRAGRSHWQVITNIGQFEPFQQSHRSCLVFDTSAVRPCMLSHMESCSHSYFSPSTVSLLEGSWDN